MPETVHGKIGTITYESWRNMRRRCLTPTNKCYALYGGRGITITPRWNSFQNFLDDMGERPSKAHSLERNDSNGNYEKDNCRWATLKEQQRNKRTTPLFSYAGKTASAAEFGEQFGIPRQAALYHLKCGHDLAEIAARRATA